MADSEDNEKTEEATQLRREEFRKRGQVAHTKELSGGLMLLVGAMGIWAVSSFYLRNIHDLFSFSFGPDLVEMIRTGEFSQAGNMFFQKSVILIGPAILVFGFISIFSTVVQVGFLNVEDALSLKPERVNPLAGFQRIFAFRSLVEAFKSIIKIFLITGVIYLALRSQIALWPNLMTQTVEQMFGFLGVSAARVLASIGASIVGMSLVDYFYQRWDLEKKMMMTKQEIKEENKSREGDPLIKARIRRVQREMANRRMMDAVPKGDVVITNPTHIACVLKYDANLPAPQLIAKGGDLIAEKIKAIAKEHKIPIVENKPLARTMFKTMKIGQVIPRELFVAVAEVLSYVYRLRKKVVR